MRVGGGGGEQRMRKSYGEWNKPVIVMRRTFTPTEEQSAEYRGGSTGGTTSCRIHARVVRKSGIVLQRGAEDTF